MVAAHEAPPANVPWFVLHEKLLTGSDLSVKLVIHTCSDMPCVREKHLKPYQDILPCYRIDVRVPLSFDSAQVSDDIPELRRVVGKKRINGQELKRGTLRRHQKRSHMASVERSWHREIPTERQKEKRSMDSEVERMLETVTVDSESRERQGFPGRLSSILLDQVGVLDVHSTILIPFPSDLCLG